MALRNNSEGIYNRYLKLFLESIASCLISKANGLIPGISRDDILYLKFPLPPLAEQKRIVEKLESHLAVILRAEELIIRRENLNVKIREKILQMAIEGKLVEQRPEEGTAEELYAQIQDEKKKLIAEGKIKKEKPLPEITEEEIPFDIPESWKWVKFQNISKIVTDYVANGSFASLKNNVKTYSERNYAYYVRTIDFSTDFKSNCSFVDKASFEFLEKSKLFGGELILPNIGGSIGKTFIMPKLDLPMTLAPNSIMIDFFDEVTNRFY